MYLLKEIWQKLSCKYTEYLTELKGWQQQDPANYMFLCYYENYFELLYFLSFLLADMTITRFSCALSGTSVMYYLKVRGFFFMVSFEDRTHQESFFSLSLFTEQNNHTDIHLVDVETQFKIPVWEHTGTDPSFTSPKQDYNSLGFS